MCVLGLLESPEVASVGGEKSEKFRAKGFYPIRAFETADERYNAISPIGSITRANPP